MTLDEAKKVSDLLHAKDVLESDLREISRCNIIRAELCTDGGGRPVTWNKESNMEIRYLIDGYKADIAKINAVLESLASPNFPTTERK